MLGIIASIVAVYPVYHCKQTWHSWYVYVTITVSCTCCQQVVAMNIAIPMA